MSVERIDSNNMSFDKKTMVTIIPTKTIIRDVSESTKRIDINNMSVDKKAMITTRTMIRDVSEFLPWDPVVARKKLARVEQTSRAHAAMRQRVC